MQTKTVGVVIPVYNVEKYLKECLDSVINQSYTNLEIILVNDGSTDENSLNIAKEYTLKDKRITL
ncbi:TPA: glycosyltransferase family 2 protein, partial [Campylobacter coli]|nr:glycosyltransferase family 2 protein [Campylobacter coli]